MALCKIKNIISWILCWGYITCMYTDVYTKTCINYYIQIFKHLHEITYNIVLINAYIHMMINQI